MDTDTDKITIELTVKQWELIHDCLEGRQLILEVADEIKASHTQEMIWACLTYYYDEKPDLTKPLEL